VRVSVPLSEVEKSYVAEGGNAVPSYTVATLAVPRGFDPKKTWPVLIVFSSSDHLYPNWFDMTALFAGATGFWTEYAEQYSHPLMYTGSAFTKFLDSWHTVNPDDNVFDPNTKWVSGKYPAMGYNYDLINNSTKGVLDATYVRLKTIEFGYSLPRTLLSKAGIKGCRVYVNGYNIFTVTGLEGVDPEHPGQVPSGDFGFGLGGYKYPLNRTFNVGANVSF